MSPRPGRKRPTDARVTTTRASTAGLLRGHMTRSLNLPPSGRVCTRPLRSAIEPASKPSPHPMAKRKRRKRGSSRRARIPDAQQQAWTRNHAAQSRFRNSLLKYRRQQARTEDAKKGLRKIMDDCYELGASPPWFAKEMGITPQAVRKTWLLGEPPPDEPPATPPRP